MVDLFKYCDFIFNIFQLILANTSPFNNFDSDGISLAFVFGHPDLGIVARPYLIHENVGTDLFHSCLQLHDRDTYLIFNSF